jgi:hypothetical protein
MVKAPYNQRKRNTVGIKQTGWIGYVNYYMGTKLAAVTRRLQSVHMCPQNLHAILSVKNTLMAPIMEAVSNSETSASF